MSSVFVPPPPTSPPLATGQAYASLGPRIGAYIIDGALPMLLLAPGYAVVLLTSLTGDYFAGGGVLLGIGSLLVVALCIYQWRGVALRGQSVGKRVLGIRVVDDQTGRPIGWMRALVRYLVLALLGSCGGLLLLVQLFVIPKSPRRQGWHDSAARTVVEPAQGALPGTGSPVQAAGRTSGVAQTPPQTPPTPRPSTPPSTPSLATGATPVPPPPVASPPPVSPPPVSPPPVSAPPVVSTPVSPPPTAEPTPAPAAPVPHEHTVLVGRDAPPVSPAPAAPQSGWRLVADDGSVFEVSDTVVVGREPDASLVPGASTFPVADKQRTMSKTHAVLRASADALTVEDLASTNGVHLTVGAGEIRISASTPTALAAGQRVSFGDCTFVVERAE